MKKMLSILLFLLCCLNGSIVFAEEPQKETPKKVNEISKEDMEIIKVLEVLKLMDLMENMDMVKEMDNLIEEEPHEDTE
jgi:hypothetical protein